MTASTSGANDPRVEFNAQRCSRIWDANQLPSWGTAPMARFWVLLEQPGPWGRVAATESHLDPALGAELDQACADRGGRFALIRSTAPQESLPGPVRALVGGGLGAGEPGRTPWLGSLSLDSPAELVALLASLDTDADQRPSVLEPSRPVLAVCTNGKRDACCAIRGRPLAAEVAAAAQAAGLGTDRVCEASHLGGHRFSPTALLLPSAQLLGRLNVPAAIAALEAADQERLAMPGIGYERGRTHLEPRAQVGEIVSRYRHGVDDPAGLGVTTDGDVVQVRHGSATDQVRVTSAPAGDWPASCGKPAEPTQVWQASVLDGSRQ